ncbi:MAG: HNH endonuclease [Actinomycetota bacterium]|nr:HNH endonuclease [Actinomycetota bacterium]
MRTDGLDAHAGVLPDDVVERLRSVDPASLSAHGLTAVARRARSIERAGAALVATVGAEANRRKEQADRAASEAAPGGERESHPTQSDSGEGEIPFDEAEASGGDVGGAEEALRDPTVSARQARQEVRRSKIAHQFSAFGAAVARGSVSVDHLDVLYWAVDPLSPEVVALLIERSDHLVSRAERHPPRPFAKVLRALIDTLCSVAADQLAAAQRAASELIFWRSTDGMGHFRGTLDPERFDLLVNQVEAKISAMIHAAEREGVTLSESANLSAATLLDLAICLDGGGGNDRRPLIHLLVDAKTAAEGSHEDTVCETVSGDPVPLSLLGHYACGAVIQAVLQDEDGLPLRVGRQYRSATAAQWAALTSIYSHCAWPECDQPVSRCQAHHVWSWEDGGPTDLDNLVPLCSHHHVMVHHRGWRIRVGAGRKLEVFEPNGELFAVGRPNRVPGRAEDGGRDREPGQESVRDRDRVPDGDGIGDRGRVPDGGAVRDRDRDAQAREPP